MLTGRETTPRRFTIRWCSMSKSTTYRPTKPGPLWEKKDKHCNPHDPADQDQGSQWDHVLLDTESRLIVSLVVGKRTTETLQQAFRDFYQRTDGGLPVSKIGRASCRERV